jgi:hypothetical protein
MNRAISTAIFCLGFAACSPPESTDPFNEAATSDNGMHGAPEPHQFVQRGAASKTPTPLQLKGGSILTTPSLYAIWWGDWSSPGDKISGIESFFNGYTGSSYANTITEYYDINSSTGKQEPFTGHSVFNPSLYDASAAPPHAINTSTAVSEACTVLKNNSLTPDPNAIYFIYTSTGAGHVSYCAWHDKGTCPNGTTIQVAYMPNIDGLPGCDPLAPYYGHSEGLAALANVTAHELSEAITDPHLDAWLDQNGQEVGDKCAWQFDTTNNQVTLSNGTQFKLQKEWSNAANGCIQTK